MYDLFIPGYVALCRERMRKFDPAETLKTAITDGQIIGAVDWAVSKVSRRVPQIVEYTIEFQEAKKVLDLTDLLISDVSTNLADKILEIRYAQYPVDDDPQVNRRNVFWEIGNQKAIINMSATPTIGDEIKLVCGIRHTLTNKSSSIPETLEEAVVAGACFQALFNLATSTDNAVNLGRNAPMLIKQTVTMLKDQFDSALSECHTPEAFETYSRG